jgi:hypothetical protein
MAFLQSLIGIKDDDALFKSGLSRLEKMTGNSGIDISLIADIIEKSHKVYRELSLDHTDMTAHELYFALNAAARINKAEWLLLDTDYVLAQIDGEIVSLNLIDVIENSHHELSFARRIISHGRRSLRGELVSRYVSHARTDNKSAKEVAKSIGLIQKNDACYTKNKHKNNTKHGGNKPQGEK